MDAPLLNSSWFLAREMQMVQFFSYPAWSFNIAIEAMAQSK